MEDKKNQSKTKLESTDVSKDAANKDKKKINLIKFQATDNQQIIECEEEIAKISSVLKGLIETTGRNPNDAIQIPNNIKFEIFQKIVEFYKLPKSDQTTDDVKPSSVNPKEEEFMDAIKDNQDNLFKLINAADCLAFDVLLNVACKTMADKMKGKTINEIRTLFKIENNGGFTQQDEEAIDKENEFFDKDFDYY